MFLKKVSREQYFINTLNFDKTIPMIEKENVMKILMKDHFIEYVLMNKLVFLNF